MSPKKKASPATVAAMGGAALAAVGFAGWNIVQAVSPAPAAAPAAPPALPESRPAEGAPSPVRDTSGAPSTPAAPKEAASAGDTAENLAVDANPFAPLPAKAVSQNAPGPVVLPAAPLGPLGGPQRMGAPAFGTPFLPAGPQARPAPPAEEKEPQLVGTLLGERPSAVFRMDKVLSVVPEGASLGSWKVISVAQGGAVIKNARRTLTLSVGAGGGSVMTSEKPVARAARQESVLASAFSVPSELARPACEATATAGAASAEAQSTVAPAQDTPSPQSAPAAAGTATEMPPAAD
jgi:hypothetical protein